MHGKTVAIIGGGPAGLMAADVLSAAGLVVTVYEAMPTVARKFLMAGKSGLNITHSEDYARFATRFGNATERLRPALDAFTAQVEAFSKATDVAAFTAFAANVLTE